MSELVYYRDLDEQLLVFPILGNPVGIELKYIKRISLVSDLIPIPRSPDYILGIVNLESNIYPILDLDILLSGQKNEDDNNVIISLIETKDAIFGVHTHQLPQVIAGTVGDEEGSIEQLPEDWILGYTETKANGKIAIINPTEFWISIGDNEVVGPFLETKITAADLNSEDVTNSEDMTDEDETSLESDTDDEVPEDSDEEEE